MAYHSHPHHRAAAYAFEKSQWRISVEEEVQTYELAVAANWQCEECYWGLHLIGAIAHPLGVSPAPNQQPLNIAKFVGANGDWHGYPVAHWLSPWDKPRQNILQAWREAGLITPAKMAKILRGKRCTL